MPPKEKIDETFNDDFPKELGLEREMYKKQIRDELVNYLNELLDDIDRGGNAQLYERINSTIERVLEDPTLMKYIKKGMGEFRAAPVLQQVRLFFRYSSVDGVVEFVWVNDENTPHISEKGDRDPCYKKFKDKLSNGDFGEFVVKEDPRPKFEFTGDFRKNKSIMAITKGVNGDSHAQLFLLWRDENFYEVRDFHEEPEYGDSLAPLISSVAEKAEHACINLLFFPDSSLFHDLGHLEDLLSGSGFVVDAYGGEEAFVRSA